MNISITIEGHTTFIQRLFNFLVNLDNRLEARVTELATKVQKKVQDDKLSGQVLNIVTGRLRDSIYQEVTRQGHTVTGTVGTRGVPYAAIHEFGGVTKPHTIVPVNARALHFWWHGVEQFRSAVRHPGSRIPQRSYLQSTINDMRMEILEQMGITVGEAERGT